MIDILQKIVDFKRREVERAKIQRPIHILKEDTNFSRRCNSLSKKLKDPASSGIIAEFKRKSPSKDDINLHADLETIVKGYADAGASGISILTDEHFFGGNNEYLTRARNWLPEIPLLRKEFIIDEYQIYESKAIGADIILLIAEILTYDEVLAFSKVANSLGMEILLELHGEDQLLKTTAPVSILGINNRNLKTFEVDYQRSINLLNKLRDDVPRIAESGLSHASTLVMLKKAGFEGFLIGEQFMKGSVPSDECAQFVNHLLA